MSKTLPPIGQTQDLGIPVKSISWVRLHPGVTSEGKPSLLITAGQNHGGIFLMDVDLESGHCRIHPGGNSAAEFPTSAVRSLRNGVVWIASAWCGHLHRYDPAHPGRGLEDLGPIAPGKITFPTGIAEDRQGRIYIGAYPNATLTRFDPSTGTFTHFGAMDPEDNYLYPLIGDDGTVAAQVKMSTYRIIVFDPETGSHTRVGPSLESPIGKSEAFLFFKGEDGLLYLDSFAGKFLLRGMEAIPVEKVPPPMAGVHATNRHAYQMDLGFPDGTFASLADAEAFTFRCLVLKDGKGKVLRELPLDWEGQGTEIFLLHLGPEGKIYGSSMLPEHLFSCHQDGSGMTDHGQVSLSGGEAYSMCNYGEILAVGSYPATRLSLYDPRLPYSFGTGPGANPLDIGRMDDASTRPHSLITTPDGKLWAGSAADYGLWHGSLSWYDPATASRGSYREILPYCTPVVLRWIDSLQRILIGFNIETGTGTTVRAERGAFALWDTKAGSAEYIGDFGDEELADVCSLGEDGQGRIYAISGRNPRLIKHYGATVAPTRLLLLDVMARKVIASRALEESVWGELPFETGDILRRDEDGTLYGATRTRVFRIQPGTVDIELVAEIGDGQLTVVGPVTNGTLFFASHWRLRKMRLR